MNIPSLPPSFGSWQPSFSVPYNQHWGPDPLPWMIAHPETGYMGPRPEPWWLAASYLVSMICLKEAASQLQNEQLKKELIEQLTTRMQEFIDDYCKTPYPHGPYVAPWAQSTASELVLTAHSLQEGSLRNQILIVATTLLQTALSNPTQEQKTTV